MILSSFNYVVFSIFIAAILVFITIHLKKDVRITWYNVTPYIFTRFFVGGGHLSLLVSSNFLSLVIQSNTMIDLFSLLMVFFYLFFPYPMKKEAGSLSRGKPGSGLR